MKANKPLDNDQLEQATLYALGCLDPDQNEEFRHLLKQNTRLSEEIASFHPVLEAMGNLVPQVAPPPHLRQRLNQAITATQSAKAKPATITTVRPADLTWQPMGVPGISFKTLSVDPELGRVTMLIKVQPGSSYPPHQHLQREESMVLEGDLVGDGLVLGAGDYMSAAKGSSHGILSSQQGCIVLVMASTEDKLLPLAI